MAVSKAEVLQAMGYLKQIMDAANEDKFALKDEVWISDDGSTEELKSKVESLASDVDDLKTTTSDNSENISELQSKSDGVTYETITYSDVAKLFT